MKAMENRERGSAGQHQAVPELCRRGAVMKKGWQTKRLGDVCEIIKGRKPALKATSSNGDLPYLVAKVMRGSKEAEYASVKDRNSITVEESETIIICDGSNSGEVFTGFRGILSSTMGKIAKKAEIDDDYLRAFLASTFDVFNGAKTGAAIPHLDKEAMYQLQFPFPPLAEQQRIVGLLDEAFEGIATAKANAEKNLQNARALFESHLQSVFTQRGPGWVEKSLGETCEMYQPKTIGTKDLVPDGPYPVFGANGVIGRYDKFNHEEPQLLVTCRGATCGSVNISEPNSWITGNAMVVRPKDQELDLHFLEFVFRGGIDISAAITGAAQPQITRTNLSPLLIRFPKSVTEQARLADEFEKLTEETQRLARLYEQKLAALEALMKSLLHQAFTGEL